MPTKDRTGLAKWGMALAAAREAKGMTVRQLAEAAKFSAGTISKYENGNRMPGNKEIAALERALEIGDCQTPGRLKGLFDELVGLQISPEWSEWREIEKDAVRLLSYEHSVIPGLLQHEEYAKTVLSYDTLSALNLDQRLGFRMERQKILDQESPPTAVFIIGDFALTNRVGSSEVMRHQLEHLIEMAKRQHIIIQVTPQDSGFHPGFSGAFMLAKLDSAEFGYQDALWKGQVLKEGIAVSALGNHWQYIQSKACNEEESLDLLKKVADKWKH